MAPFQSPEPAPAPKREHASPHLSASDPDRHAILQTMLDHVAQGIAMFDAGHRLIGWNDELRKLLDLSDDLMARAPPTAAASIPPVDWSATTAIARECSTPWRAESEGGTWIFATTVRCEPCTGRSPIQT